VKREIGAGMCAELRGFLEIEAVHVNAEHGN
jgi:hypothetical protein